jgi:hypothetical protein
VGLEVADDEAAAVQVQQQRPRAWLGGRVEPRRHRLDRQLAHARDGHLARAGGDRCLLAGQRPRALDGQRLVPDGRAEALAQRQHELHVGLEALAVDHDRGAAGETALHARREPREAFGERRLDALLRGHQP